MVKGPFAFLIAFACPKRTGWHFFPSRAEAEPRPHSSLVLACRARRHYNHIYLIHGGCRRMASASTRPVRMTPMAECQVCNDLLSALALQPGQVATCPRCGKQIAATVKARAAPASAKAIAAA